MPDIEPPTPEEIAAIKKTVASLDPSMANLTSDGLQPLPALARLLQIIIYQHETVAGIADVFDHVRKSSSGTTDEDVKNLGTLIARFEHNVDRTIAMAGHAPIDRNREEPNA